MTSNATDQRPAPTWRGLLHELAILPVLVAGVWLTWTADSVLGGVAFGVHVLTLVTMLTTSAIYHRHCRDDATRRLARRADHAAIFALIAGSYGPIALFAVPRWLGVPVLAAVWLVALRGASLKLMHLELGQDRFHSWMYGAMGWAAVMFVPWMIVELGLWRFGLVILGGAAYSAGGLVLIRRRPDPSPAHFGYHEIWHSAVLFAAVAHLAVSTSLV